MIAGVPDKMAKRFNRTLSSQPDLALKTNQKVDYKILLAHQPSSVFDLVNEKCDLILSGHTHGGQIFPFHLFVRLVQPVVAGFKKINGTLVFAHQGTGFWGPPMRWFSQSEIVKINWK
jgi:predicted MPP superfamily phosphohydrolase